MSRTGDYGWGRLSKGSQRTLESWRESAFHGPGIDLLAEKTIGAKRKGRGRENLEPRSTAQWDLESWSELHFDSFKHSLNIDSLNMYSLSSHSAELWGFKSIGGWPRPWAVELTAWTWGFFRSCVVSSWLFNLWLKTSLPMWWGQ